MFNSLSDRLTATFRNLRGKGRLSEADVDAAIREIRRALLDADVALPVVRSFTGRVRERALSEEVSQALNPGQQVVKIVGDELKGILGGQTRRLEFAKKPPTVIMLAGLQGAGKTTLAGKLAHWLRGEGHRPMLVACDLQRPNAVNQLQVMGERASVPVYAPEPGNGVGDPVAVAKDSIEEARQKLHDVVIVDTAGRLGIDQELMQQAADIRAAVNPDEVLFVIDAMIGQDAVQTAEAFLEGVDFTGVVLSKLDGDSRGGAALSVAEVTGKPIMFASTGEGLKDFEQFHPDRMADRILDMGDIMTLIEQAERTFDKKEAEKLAKKVESGDGFDLEDFLKQIGAIRKMGSMKKMLGMIPGMAQHRQLIEQFDEREFDRIEAIIRSMTPAERANPKILNGSRRARIARGAGVEVSRVNQLMEQFAAMQKMMKQMGGGRGMPQMPGMPAMPGMPGMGAGGGRKQRRKSGGKKRSGAGKSGNPAKRAQQEREAQLRREGKAPSQQGASFGGIDLGDDEEFDLSKLPKGFGGFSK
ncbi:signal recognition particle protein [Brevibacterium ravenspurgense]|uniref:signal recognition particle protein n=1 Tax=Brevibacterium ravenspurgense TaxID=479117 RepID=UPI001EF20953|nr:signal recognition particle protein [Brevibacterium ravenspurgense]